MGKASPLQSNFLGGELSPFFMGQVDNPRYKTGLAECLNYIPLLQGGMTRRPGTYFAAEINDSTRKAVLIRFQFSITQAYMLEFGHNYIRFYRNYGQIVESAKTITGITNANPGVVTSAAHGFSNGDEVVISGVAGMTTLNGRNFKVANVTANTFTLKYLDGGAVDTSSFAAYTSGGTAERVYTVTTTYTESEVPSLTVVQSADVLYICHPSHAPAKLSRTDHTNWTLTDTSFLDGPYLPQDTSGKTLTPSSATGSTTITASGALFAATDVGRLIRVQVGSTWSWLKITAYTDSTHVTAAIQASASIGTSAISAWRLGIWSATTGYPAAATFHEDRLCFAGAAANPQRFDMSVTSDYENFAPTATDGTVNDDNAVSRSLNSDEVNNVFWMKSAEKGMLIGCPGGAWAVTPSFQSEAISPLNVKGNRVSTFGSAQIQPMLVGKSMLYVQSTKRTMRELSYYFEEDGYRAPDRTVLADHIAGTGGFTTIAYQKDKPAIVWCCRNDGQLAGMTYEREDDALIVAWHRHIYGGVSNAGGADAIVESINTIPSPDGTREDLWLIVQRYIGGRIVRYVEFQTKIFEHQDLQQDAFHVDCGLAYNNPVVISGVSNANPGVVTATAHGFANGDKVLISGVLGMTALNGNSYVVRNVTANTFTLEAMDGAAVDTTDTEAFPTYAGDGEVRKFISGISGMWHLEGETVDIYGDGGVQPQQVVTNGSITFQTPATVAAIGYAFKSRGKLLRQEAGAASGTALGKNRRTNRVSFLFYRTLGFKFGSSTTAKFGEGYDNLQEIIFRTNDDPDGRAPALFSGIKSDTLDADYDFENYITFEQDRPFPGTVLAVGPQLDTQERG